MNKHLETVTRNWDVLPWHFKAKIILICEYYYSVSYTHLTLPTSDLV